MTGLDVRFGFRLGNTRYEQMFSALAPITDIATARASLSRPRSPCGSAVAILTSVNKKTWLKQLTESVR
jgi:hypothetical protein